MAAARLLTSLGLAACAASLVRPAPAQAQGARPGAAAGAKVRGTVVDEAGAPIAGATVLVGDHAVVTGADGAFVVTGGGGGGGGSKLTVIASGYEAQTLGATDGVVVRLARADGEVIEVTGRAPEESKPLEYTISASDVRTTPGAMNDALRAVTVLPAAARIPFSFGGLVLRGMSPRDSSVFIDGVEIPLAFHFGGITGVFPTQVLGDMKVVPSGFDVSLGRTQGGAIELASRLPRGDTYRIGGEVSLLHSIASAEGPLPGRGAFLVALRRSYLDVLAQPLVSRNDPLPSYTDGQLRGVWGDARRRGQLAAYVIGSLDRIANSEDAARPNDPEAGGYVAANVGFVRAGASYKRRIDKTLVTVAPSVGTNLLSLHTKDYQGTSMLSELDISRRWYVFGGRGEWLRDDPGGFLRAGLDVSGGYLGRVSAKVFQDDADEFPVPRNTVLWTDAAIFAEARRHWYGDRLSVRPGLRIDRFGLGDEWAIDPRVNAHAALSPITRVRASLGRFHQPPSPAHFDEFTDNLGAKSSYVDQATLGVEWTPEPALTASVTAFGHRGKKTLVDAMADNPRDGLIDIELIFRELLEDQLGLYGYQGNVGRQLSYGLEVALRYDADSFRAMANYAWSRSKRKYDPALGGGWEPYGLDQPMRLNLLFATTALRWNIGSRLTVVSGNPVHVVPEGTPVPDDFEEPPTVLVRLPTFWQLDVRIDRRWKRPWGSISLFFDIQNITNHRNVEFRESRPDFDPFHPDAPTVYRYEDVRGLPILPYIGVEFVPR
ncbi:MAG TPA: TonB-dependent receptor [Kofleriaceae bacterium]|nr:TonB-dependent receptor [Kofleriaceae bacterium]